MIFRQVIAATTEPLTLAEVRIHLRQAQDAPALPDPPLMLDDAPDDSWVLAKITAARQWAEGFLGRLLSDATYEVVFDAFTAESMKLPQGSDSIAGILYLDTANAVTTLAPASYTFDPFDGLYVTSVPAASSRIGSVRVRVQGTVSLEEDIKQALLLVIGHWYENREASLVGKAGNLLPLGVESLLRPLRIRLGMA